MENTNVTEQSTNEIMPMAASGETNFASLKEKTTPASGDMFLMEDSEDTKKINYDKLADAILNKLTSKTYSGLKTTAKNFVTAINELNSNFKMDSNVTIDCNEVTDFLTFCNNDSQNLPIKTFGILMTLTRDQNISLQIFGIATAENHMYTRTKIGGTWTAWYRFQLQPAEQS